MHPSHLFANTTCFLQHIASHHQSSIGAFMMTSQPNLTDQRQAQRGTVNGSFTPPIHDNSAAGPQSSTSHIPYLKPTQQDLLVAALNSQIPQSHTQNSTSSNTNTSNPPATGVVAPSQDMSRDTLYQSPATVSMDQLNGDFTPDLYDFDGDNSFDFDNADLGGEMIGALPDSIGDDQHEKRKMSDDYDDDLEEGDAKRQETQDGERGAKKPGRKPLTSEPTTKRKAQNRAAQRAFRERKERHLKDLESKVNDLTKAQEADKHEKGLLRAQVDRLQVELKDYRKRLSLNGGGVKGSPPLAATRGSSNTANFSFDFPQFGSLPTQMLTNPGNGLASNNVTPPALTHSPGSGSFSSQNGQISRHNSQSRSMSPNVVQNHYSGPASPTQMTAVDASPNPDFAAYSTNDNMHGFASTLPQMGASGSDPFGDLFSPSILKSVAQPGGVDGGYFSSTGQATDNANTRTNNGGDSTAGIPDHRVFRFNSASVASDTASPSASSSSHWNNNAANSSCGTSPEPVTNSPALKEKSNDTFAEKSVNTSNNTPSSSLAQFSNLQPSNDLNFANLSSNATFNVPHASTFDPVLFGDYRESNDGTLGTGDFNSTFFDDSLNSGNFDLGSPSNLFGILAEHRPDYLKPLDAPTPSRNLMAEIDKARDGGDDDYGLPTAQPSKVKDSNGNLISCTKIWSQLQSNQDFQDGKFDLDGLCSELRSKARCSESGLVVDKDHVDRALKRLATNTTDGNPNKGELMFEQDSWDNVLRKMSSQQKR